LRRMRAKGVVRNAFRNVWETLAYYTNDCAPAVVGHPGAGRRTENDWRSPT
jgi:hypothetical protein